MLSRTANFILLTLMATWGIVAISHAQSDFTWTGANGSWTDTGNWTVSGNGTGYPDATDDAVYFSQNTTTIDISMPTDSSAVAGTITMNGTGTGTVRLGNATTFAGNLTLDSTSAPILNVNSGRLAIFTELIGSQGFRKTGGGILNFNTNTLNMTNLTGNVSIEDGTVYFQQAGNFGGGNLSFSGSNTLFQLRGNLTTTFSANKNISISTGSNINFWNFDTLSGMVFEGPITGSGNLTFTNGNFTINGANTYSGNTTVAGSGPDKAVNILLGSGSNLSNGTLNFTSQGTAVINLGGNAQTIQNLVTESSNTGSSMTISNGTLAISGGGDISLGGRGGTFTLSLANLSSFTAGTASSNFTFQSGNTTGTTTNTLTLSTNGTNTITGQTVLFGRTSTGGASTGAAYSANVNLGAVNTINADTLKVGSTNATSALAFQAGLSNPSLTLRSANGTGAVGEWIIGELTAETGGRSGLGTVDLQGGTLDALVGNLTVGLNSNSTVNSVSWLKISAGNLSADTIRLATKSGSSIGGLSGTIYQSGGNVSVGVLEFGQSGSGNSTITAIYELTGGRLEVGDIQVGGGNFTNTSNRTLLMSGNATLTNVSGSNLTITGASNSASGLMKINISGNATLLASNGDIVLGSNSSLTGSGSLTKNGSGDLILSGTSSFTGTTNINQGAVVLGANQNLGAIAGSGNLSLGTYTLTTNASSSTTFSGAISGSGGLTKNGTGTLTLTGELSYTGNTSINTGTVVIGSPSQLGGGSYSGNIANSGTLIYSGTSNQTLSGIISGAGVLTHNASSRLTLTGNNSYSGNTAITNGTLEITTNGRLGGGNYSGNITNSGQFVLGSNSNQTLSGQISGNGAITKNGTGTLTLNGSNNYSGNTTINAGTVVIGNSTGLGASGNITFGGGTLQYGSGITTDISTRIKNSGSAILIHTNNNDITFAGTLDSSNSGGLTKNGTGTLTLAGNSNYSGNTTINTGTVLIGHANGAGTGRIVQTDISSLLKFDTIGTITNNMSVYNVLASQSATLSGAITVNNATWDVENGATITITGNVSGSGGVTKNGNGTLLLSGNNTYAAATTINAGTLNASSANALGLNNTVQVNGGTLLVSADNAINGMNITLNGTSTTVATLSFTGNYGGAVGNLTLSANSIIDFGTGSTRLSFHDIEMGIYYLKFHNWTGATVWGGGTGNDTDRVYIISGVTNNELGKMQFYSGTTSDSFLGTGFDLGLTATSFDLGLSGYQIIPVPEPETWAVGCLLLLCGSFWMWRSGRLQKTISS